MVDAACHATTVPPKIGPPGPFMAATAGPPGPFVVLQMVPQTNYGAVIGPPLPQLVPSTQYNPAFITF